MRATAVVVASETPYIADLVARKIGGAEKSTLSDADFTFHQGQVRQLQGVLEGATFKSVAGGAGSSRALNDLLLRVRREWPSGKPA